MIVNKLKDKQNNIINGPLEIIPNVFSDERGYFYESWNQRDFDKFVASNISFVQDNQSLSKKGTLRGLHFQLNPMAQGKLVRATKGKVFDVIVDLREASTTFASWTSLVLDSENKNQIWIPEGFAHGFLTLSEEAIVDYKTTNLWNKDLDRSIRWNDPIISIKWPQLDDNFHEPYLSFKDKNALKLESFIEKGELF